jgi:hypothetical protein
VRIAFDAHRKMLATYHTSSWRQSTPAATLRTLAGGLALLACLCAAVAQETPMPAGILDHSWLVGASDKAAALPSDEVTALRSRLQAPAVPLASLDARTANDPGSAVSRVWISRGRADVGVGIGMQRYLEPSVDRLGNVPQAVVGAVPALTVGVRYRVSDQHSVFAGAYGARGLATDPTIPLYAAKVGVEWQPSKSNLGLEQGAIGMHFDSGYKLSLKVRHGGPTLYVRGQF